MVVPATTLISELRNIVAGKNGESDRALRTLAARTLELAELVQAQNERIEVLARRLELRSG
jgi:hypothetical protein